MHRVRGSPEAGILLGALHQSGGGNGSVGRKLYDESLNLGQAVAQSADRRELREGERMGRVLYLGSGEDDLELGRVGGNRGDALARVGELEGGRRDLHFLNQAGLEIDAEVETAFGDIADDAERYQRGGRDRGREEGLVELDGALHYLILQLMETFF